MGRGPEKKTPEYAKKPQGVIPKSTGIDFYYPEGATVCGLRDKDCYNDGFGWDIEKDIPKLDEYYTACGYGNPSGWTDGQIRHGKHFEMPSWSIITDGKHGSGDNNLCEHLPKVGFKLAGEAI